MKIRIIYCTTLFLCLLFITSCKEASKKTTDIPTQKETSNPLFFKAYGTEPNWQLEVYQKENEYHYKLNLNNNNKEKTGIFNLKQIEDSNYALFTSLESKDGISVHIKMQKTIDLSGQAHQGFVIVTHLEKTHVGYGDFKTDNSLKKELITANKVAHYICYTNNKNKRNKMWLSFNEKSIGLQVKYQGQQDAIDLVYVKSEYEKGGAHPTITNYYNEIYGGTINGTYKTTHSGNWDYVEYTRGKDGKVFQFTIDHTQNPYGTTPCF